ncbi:MAG: hypothetical protein KGJ46_06270 [Xanthomonadaceae bacterium]|nr:hypothetical protein [Xanthomonadaceae bacterium]
MGVDESPGDFDDDDYRKDSPHFEGKNFAKNIKLVDRVRELASGKGCTSTQLALVLAQGRRTVPIPGPRREVP